MPYVVDAAAVEPATRVLLGAIDVDGGPTDEQLAFSAATVRRSSSDLIADATALSTALDSFAPPPPPATPTANQAQNQTQIVADGKA